MFHILFSYLLLTHRKCYFCLICKKEYFFPFLNLFFCFSLLCRKENIFPPSSLLGSKKEIFLLADPPKEGVASDHRTLLERRTRIRYGSQGRFAFFLLAHASQPTKPGQAKRRRRERELAWLELLLLLLLQKPLFSVCVHAWILLFLLGLIL